MKNLSVRALAGVMLSSILLMGTMIGCTSADVQKAVSQVAAEMPAVESAVAAASALASVADPALAPVILPLNGIAQIALPQLQGLLQAYASNPTANTFANITTVIDSIVTNGDTALLAASKISNPESQQKATAILASLDALLHVIDGFISQAQTPAQVQAKVAARTLKLKQVSQYWSDSDKSTVAAAFHAPYSTVYHQAVVQGF